MLSLRIILSLFDDNIFNFPRYISLGRAYLRKTKVFAQNHHSALFGAEANFGVREGYNRFYSRQDGGRLAEDDNLEFGSQIYAEFPFNFIEKHIIVY